MTPRAWIVALALAIPFWIALLIISASAASPSPITPLPQSAFSPFGATEGAGSRDSSVGRAPRRPMADDEVAGSSPVPGVSPAPSLAPTFVQVTPHPTTRPVSRTVPPVDVSQGAATWYAAPIGTAAAAARLRAFLGVNWRGMRVRVTGPAGSVVVLLDDYESSTIPGRLIDLNPGAFQSVCGPLSRGVCTVTLEVYR